MVHVAVDVDHLYHGGIRRTPTAIGLAATAVGGNGIDGDGRDVDGLGGDGGGRLRVTTAAADDGGMVADNRQLPERGRAMGEVGSTT